MAVPRPEIVDSHDVPAGADEIMLLLFWHLGDVLNSTALLPALRERHGRRLTFVTAPPCVPILRNHPDLERIRVIDFRPPSRVSPDLWQRLSTIHEEFFPGHATVYNLHLRPPDLKRMSWHIIEHWAQLLDLGRRRKPWRPQFRPEGSFAHESSVDYLALCNGGADPVKHWPEARWQRLLVALRERHPTLAYVQDGAPSDTGIDGVQDRRGTTIDESYWLLRRARACITNDSFLAHLAAVTGCPTVTIFGPTSPRHFRPLAPETVTTVGGHAYRTPCSRNLCRFVRGHLPCLAFPSVSQVLAATERALLLANPHDESP